MPRPLPPAFPAASPPRRRGRARAPLLALLVAVGGGVGWLCAQPPGRGEPLRQALLARATGDRAAVIRGAGDWLFLPAEFVLLGAGDFWLDPVRAGSAIADPALANPLPAILEFRDQLAARGVALLFVAVPSKLAIYPEQVTGAALRPKPERYDGRAAQFLATLEQRGVRTLDLAPDFLAERAPAPDALYLATDSHWSPRGCRLAAQRIARRLRELGLAGAAPPAAGSSAAVREEWRERAGDLADLAPGGRPRPERILLRRVPAPAPGSAAPAGPVLLLGDSHLEVYHALQSGLADHLGAELGAAPDQIAVQAGGPTASRQALGRAPSRLAGKSVVVWVLAERFFVSGPGWSRVPPPL